MKVVDNSKIKATSAFADLPIGQAYCVSRPLSMRNVRIVSSTKRVKVGTQILNQETPLCDL